MRKIQLTIASFVILFVIVLLASCVGEKKQSTLKADAEKFVKIKCENRIELSKYAADTTITKVKLDSLRKVLNKDLKEIRNKYSKDDALEKKFKEAVSVALEAMPECKEIFNKDKKDKKEK